MSNKYYAVKHIDNGVRLISASGGVFYALAKEVLKQNGSVYGAALDDTWSVKHVRVTEEENLRKLQGSKYPQSSITGIWTLLNEDIADNKLILFCGTPCQTKAVKVYVGEYENIILCDIVCHGVASPSLFKEYILWLEKKLGKIASFSFREKSLGWKRQVWSIRRVDGRLVAENDHIDTFRNLYYKHLMHRPSCFNCPYTTVYRDSDITLGDLWGADKLNLSIYDNLGISAVIVHTPNGQQWFDKINQKLCIEECKEADCLQPQLISPVNKPEEYSKFCEFVKQNMSYKKLALKFGYQPLMKRIKKFIKAVIMKRR